MEILNIIFIITTLIFFIGMLICILKIKRLNKKRNEKTEDRLTTLFKMQIKLQENYYDKKLPNDDPLMLGNIALCMLSEVGEILQEDKRWKDWCKNPPKPNIKKKKEEIIDCLHHMINFCIYSNMNEDEVFEMFKKKNKINNDRQKNNY